MPEQRLIPADPRAAFDALRALEDAVFTPQPDVDAALELLRRFQVALLGEQADADA